MRSDLRLGTIGKIYVFLDLPRTLDRDPAFGADPQRQPNYAENILEHTEKGDAVI